MNKFSWFTGKVEDIADPKKLGRVRVRIHGLHSESLVPNLATGEGIDPTTLPWALPMQDITSQAQNGLGRSPTGIRVGTIVVGFARDGELYNDLVIMGTIAGAPEGINDVNEHALGIETDLVKNKKSAVKKGVAIAGGGSWNEPETKFAAKYPENYVYTTDNGIVIEIDDTKGAERVHIYHPSGTFHEIHPDGTLVTKGKNDSFEIVLKDKNLSVGGSININAGDNCTLKVGSNCEIDVGGNTNIKTSDCIIDASGKVKVDAGGDVDVKAGGSVKISASSSAEIKASGSVTIKGSSVILKGSKTVVI